MDARTYIDTQVVGFELKEKRRAAAEARLARQAQRSGQQGEDTMEARGRARLWHGLGSYLTAKKVVAALIAALLAALLLGQVVAQQASGAVWRGRVGPRHYMVVKPGSAGQHLAVRGGRPQHRVAVQRSGAAQRVAARPIRRPAAM